MAKDENINRLYSVVVVDQDGGNLEAFRLEFRDTFNIIAAATLDDCLKALSSAEREPAVIVANSKIGAKSGLDIISKVRSINPDIVPILMSSTADPSMLVSAINRGLAGGFILKPWRADDIAGVISDAVVRYHGAVKNRRRSLQIKAVNEYLKEEIREHYRYDRVVGANGGLREALEQVRRISGSSGNVLIVGEPGSGRELLARTLHSMSPRGGRAFIKLNTSAINRSEIDAAIFGLEKISGAEHIVRAGRVELAEGSSLYIDDPADLPFETQVKLHRLITEKTYERVGGSGTLSADVRIISATRRDLPFMVSKRQFRDDFYNVISSFAVAAPPLRDRKEDIPALAQYFVESASAKHGGGAVEIDPSAMEELENYDWPGNVSELECVVKRAAQISTGGKLTADHLGFGDPLQNESDDTAGSAKNHESGAQHGNLNERLSELEKEELVDALKRAEGHKALAAKMLGINRSTLYYRMKKHGIV